MWNFCVKLAYKNKIIYIYIRYILTLVASEYGVALPFEIEIDPNSSIAKEFLLN